MWFLTTPESSVRSRTVPLWSVYVQRTFPIGVAVGPVDLLISEQLIDGVAPEVAVGEVSLGEVGGARVFELQHDLVVVVYKNGLFDGGRTGVAIGVDGPFYPTDQMRRRRGRRFGWLCR